jgi:hypothetical protein
MSREPRPFDLHLSDWFWSVVEQIRNDPSPLPEVVNRMSREELRQFYYEYREATEELYLVDHDEERGLTDEEISEASSWVVAQGREFYRAVWDDPSLLPHTDQIDLCDYSGIVAHVSWERYKQELCG